MLKTRNKFTSIRSLSLFKILNTYLQSDSIEYTYLIFEIENFVENEVYRYGFWKADLILYELKYNSYKWNSTLLDYTPFKKPHSIYYLF